MRGNAIGPSSTVHNIQVVLQQTSEKGQIGQDEIEESVGRYVARLQKCYARLDLEVLIPSGEGEHPPVELKEVFEPPFVRADPPPVELPAELHKRLLDAGEIVPEEDLPPGIQKSSLERVRQAYRDRPPVGLLEVVANPQTERIVLLGDPGAGKTSLVRFLSLALTGADVSGPLANLAGRLPVVVELRKYAEAQWRERTFEEFLDHLSTMEQLAVPRRVLEMVLRAGHALVFFDGLDELFDPAVRAEVSRRIAAFADRYPKVRIVVTSRVIGYQRGELDRVGFQHYMIQDLTVPQIGQFARNWYGTVCPHDPAKARRLYKRIMSAVDHSRPIRELAGNPLLLTILSIIGRRQELPRDRQGVYEHAVAVLIARWDQHAKHLRTPAGAQALEYLEDKDRHELLRLLARQMQDGAGGIAGNHIHGPELEATFKTYLQEHYELPLAQATVAAREMLRQFRERNFILSRFGGEVYGFIHRAFLEYLAAADIAHRYKQDREWSQDELIREVFARRADDPAWHEVLLLLVGQIGERDAARAIDTFLTLHRRRPARDRDMLVLAVRALAEVRKIGLLAPQSKAVIDALIADAEDLNDEPKGRTSQVGAELPALATFASHWSGRQRYLRWFHLRGQFLNSAEASAAVACNLYHDRDIPTVLAVHAWAPETRSAVLCLLAEHWAEDPATHELIYERATADSDSGPRGTAFRLLAEHWRDDPATYALICSRVTADPNREARDTALKMLAEHWGDHQSTHQMIYDWAAANVKSDTQRTALRMLAKNWTEDPATHSLIYERATADPDSDAAAAAFNLLTAYWPGDPATNTLVYERVTGEAFITRFNALVYLGEHCAEDSAARERIYDLAAGDSEWIVRFVALTLAVKNWAEASATRELVYERVTAETEEGPRGMALGLLAQHWADDPATRELIYERATADPEDGPRLMALGLLAEHWADDPATRELVYERATADPESGPRGTALGLLAEHWADDPATRELVYERATADPESGPRGRVLGLLAEHWADDPATRELVYERATADPESGPRLMALGLLAEHWADDPATRELVYERATADPESGPRGRALGLLAEHWADDPATRELIYERATADPAPDIRRDALHWLTCVEAGAAAEALVRDRAVVDLDAQVRLAAVRVLSFGWPTWSTTTSLLRDRAKADEDEKVRTAASHALAVVEALAPLQEKLPEPWGIST